MMNFQINNRVRIETNFYGKYHGKMGTVIGLNCVNEMIKVKFDEAVNVNGVLFENDIFCLYELKPI